MSAGVTLVKFNSHNFFETIFNNCVAHLVCAIIYFFESTIPIYTVASKLLNNNYSIYSLCRTIRSRSKSSQGEKCDAQTSNLFIKPYRRNRNGTTRSSSDEDYRKQKRLQDKAKGYSAKTKPKPKPKSKQKPSNNHRLTF